METENRSPKAGKVAISPKYAHDRTIVTVVVLVCGTFLLAQFGEQAPVVALVSSMWTLCLTFWFRLGAEGAQ